MNNEMKANIRRTDTWQRALFMLLFAIIWTVAETILFLAALFQLGSALLTGKVNPNVGRLGAILGRYLYQIAQFVTFNSEDKPFPFGPWPEAGSELSLPKK
jgi:hypothetical protein